MITPNVTELPLRLEPTTRDPFIDEEPPPSPASAVIVDLDRRRRDGIAAGALWPEAEAA